MNTIVLKDVPERDYRLFAEAMSGVGNCWIKRIERTVDEDGNLLRNEVELVPVPQRAPAL